MGTLLALVLGFFFVEAAGYFFHRLLHTKWTGSLHRAHMTHHVKLYPPEDYLSDKYRPAGADNTTYRFLVAGVVIAALFFWLTPLWLAIPVAFDLAAFGWLNSYVHDSTHIRGHWLERFKLYQKWRAIHYLHHVDMGKNFGIVTFLADRVMKTYRKA
jgi:sterol desaturase/sphingolipid hydroxylase (fatty acid hydroxylase superfamily)